MDGMETRYNHTPEKFEQLLEKHSKSGQPFSDPDFPAE
jgi:hypothetical protein